MHLLFWEATMAASAVVQRLLSGAAGQQAKVVRAKAVSAKVATAASSPKRSTARAKAVFET